MAATKGPEFTGALQWENLPGVGKRPVTRYGSGKSVTVRLNQQMTAADDLCMTAEIRQLNDGQVFLGVLVRKGDGVMLDWSNLKAEEHEQLIKKAIADAAADQYELPERQVVEASDEEMSLIVDALRSYQADGGDVDDDLVERVNFAVKLALCVECERPILETKYAPCCSASCADALVDRGSR